jgi:ABC-type multidrug transport system permease subunit
MKILSIFFSILWVLFFCFILSLVIYFLCVFVRAMINEWNEGKNKKT